MSWNSKSSSNGSESHTSLGNGGYITAKSGSGVGNPKADGFVSMKAPNGGKTSVTSNTDGSISVSHSKGGFSKGMGFKK